MKRDIEETVTLEMSMCDFLSFFSCPCAIVSFDILVIVMVIFVVCVCVCHEVPRKHILQGLAAP